MKTEKQIKKRKRIYLLCAGAIFFELIIGVLYGSLYLTVLLIKESPEAAIRSPLFAVLILIGLVIGFITISTLVLSPLKRKCFPERK